MQKNVWLQVIDRLKPKLKKHIEDEITRFVKKFQLNENEIEMEPMKDAPYVYLCSKKVIKIQYNELTWTVPVSIFNQIPEKVYAEIDEFPELYKRLGAILIKKFGGELVMWCDEEERKKTLSLISGEDSIDICTMDLDEY